jgi:hypothetical protein
MEPTKQCEAVNRLGRQCPEDAAGDKCGRPVCWVHACALENPEREEPVQFVETTLQQTA